MSSVSLFDAQGLDPQLILIMNNRPPVRIDDQSVPNEKFVDGFLKFMKSTYTTGVTPTAAGLAVSAPNKPVNDSISSPPKANSRLSLTDLHVKDTGGAPSSAQFQQLVLDEAQDGFSEVAVELQEQISRISELMAAFAEKVVEQQEVSENSELWSRELVNALSAVVSAAANSLKAVNRATKQLEKSLNRKYT